MSVSNSYKQVNKDLWNHQLLNTRHLSGKYGIEKLSIGGQNGVDLLVKEFNFVHALAMDSRFAFFLIEDISISKF